MTGHDYEYVVAAYLRRHGYSGVTVTQGSGDYGVDVVAKKAGVRYAVQCKYYSKPVGQEAVREAVAGMAMYRCQRAMVVTNSTFTSAAEDLARINGVTLLSGIENEHSQTGAGCLLRIVAVLFWVFLAWLVFDGVKGNIQSGSYLLAVRNTVEGVLFLSVPLWLRALWRKLKDWWTNRA